MTAAPLVLAYHAIGEAAATEPLYNSFISPDAFAAQMAFLARHREVVDLDAIMADRPSTSGRRQVAITFDDGYRSVRTQAVPILERFGFPATVFVPTRWIGQRNGWDPPSPLPLDIMDAEQLSELSHRGFRIASHGHGHIDLAQADEDEAREDILASVACLTELLGERPRYLAYPYGRSSPSTRSVVQAAGFDVAFALDRVEERAGRVGYSRTPVYPHDRRWLYGAKTSGRYQAVRYAPVVTHSYETLKPLIRGRRWWP